MAKLISFMNFNFYNLLYLSDASLLINLEESKFLEDEEPSFFQRLFLGAMRLQEKLTHGGNFLSQKKLQMFCNTPNIFLNDFFYGI